MGGYSRGVDEIFGKGIALKLSNWVRSVELDEKVISKFPLHNPLVSNLRYFCTRSSFLL